MVQTLPAIVIGGPPHAGKSVLLHNLTHALYERGIRHHAIRACPDGEGNWFQEGHPGIVSTIRNNNKRSWSSEFINRMSSDLEHRALPFLVDMGGYPRMAELPIFQQCTHAILLLRADNPEATQVWESMVAEANLRPLARLFSQQTGSSQIASHTSFLEGTITGLERQSRGVRDDPVFLELVEQVASLFNSPLMQDLERVALEQAPTQLVLNLPAELHAFVSSSIEWEPAMLAPFLQRVPVHTPLSVHGWGPNWLYAALAAHAGQQAFYLFDPKISGWIQPLRVSLDEHPSSLLTTEPRETREAMILSITLPVGRLAYFQPDPLAFPPVSREKGLILDGPIPYWLLTALVRLYQQAGVPWIAPHHAQQSAHEQRKIAVVAYSRETTPTLGECIDIPE
jgi:CRISPR-associated protein Csx3